MVAGALLLSFVPVIVMYWFAYGLMNRSIDKWFSTPVEEVRADTHAMASLLGEYAAQNARAEASAIAASSETQRGFSGHGFAPVLGEFQSHEITLQGGFAIAVQGGNAEATFNAPAVWPLFKNETPFGGSGRWPARTLHMGSDRVHFGQRPGRQRWRDPGCDSASPRIFPDSATSGGQPAALFRISL